MLEHWSYNYENRVFSTPLINLSEVDGGPARTRVPAEQRRGGRADQTRTGQRDSRLAFTGAPRVRPVLARRGGFAVPIERRVFGHWRVTGAARPATSNTVGDRNRSDSAAVHEPKAAGAPQHRVMQSPHAVAHQRLICAPVDVVAVVTAERSVEAVADSAQRCVCPIASFLGSRYNSLLK